MEFKDILKNTGKIAENAARITGTLAVEGVKKAVDGAKYTKETINDSIDKAKEISSISQYCEDLREKIDKQQKAYETEYAKEVKRYSEQCDIAIEKAKTISQYQEYLKKNNTAVIVSKGSFTGASFDTGVAPDGVTIAASSIAQGVAAGAAAGAGAASLMALFGTASTGAAISSLSGAAFTHALLASFGGGAIAAGGAGMAGGMVVLGSLITVPAVIVGGNIAIKKINEKYMEAKKAEEIAKKQEVLCQEVFSQFEDAVSFMRQINHDFAMFDKVLSRVVSQLPVVANSGRAELIVKNDKIISLGADLINEFLTISLVDDINQPIFSKDLTDQLEDSILDYSNQFAFYLQEMTAEEQEIANQVEGVSLDDFNKEVERVSALTEELEQANRIIAELKKFQEMRKDAVTVGEDVNEAAKDLLIRQMPQYYKIHLQKIREAYPGFDNEDVIKLIANAELQYDILTKALESDFSSVGLEYSKAIEFIIKQMVKEGLLLTNDLTGKGKNAGKITLGQLYNTYLRSNVKILGKDFDNNMSKFLDLRNDCAHNKVISYEQMEEMKRLAITKKKGAIIPTLHRKMNKKRA